MNHTVAFTDWGHDDMHCASQEVENKIQHYIPQMFAPAPLASEKRARGCAIRLVMESCSLE